MNRYTDRQIRKIEKKRKGRAGRAGSITAIVFGACCLIAAFESTGTDRTIDLILGGILVVLGASIISKNKGLARKWDKYEACIDSRGNTTIQSIQKKTGYPTDKIRIDLQEMIRNHFFIGPNQEYDAYIDGERDMLVVTKYSSGEPLVPLDVTERREKQKKEAHGQNPDLAIIRRAIGRIQDNEAKDALYDLEGSIRRIDDRLKEKPELKEKASIRKLNEYYLPQTINLIEKLEKGYLSDETQVEIRDAIVTCADAFRNMEKNLLEKDDLDTMVDIDVLKSTFAREGLLDSDFDIK